MTFTKIRYILEFIKKKPLKVRGNWVDLSNGTKRANFRVMYVVGRLHIKPIV